MSDALLMLRLSALGDVIHTLPAANALRAAFPSRPMAWLVEAPYREFVELVAPVDKVFTVATRRWRRSKSKREVFHDVKSVRRELRTFARRGTSIDFQGLTKSAIFGAISGASKRYGFGRNSIREKIALLWINRAVEVDRHRHVVDWNLELAASAGARFGGERVFNVGALPWDPDGSLQQLMARHPVVINPGAGNPRKLWGVEKFAELSRRIEKQFGITPLVVWGPGERDMAEAIAGGGAAMMAPPTDLRQLAYLLRQARLTIAGDTGPLHLAAALGSPVIGLFGPTDPKRNGPYGQIERCVESFSGDRTMASIKIDAVMERAGETLG